MLELREHISAEELDAYVAASPFVHYMKTSMWGTFRHNTERDNASYLGFYAQNRLVAVAMVLQNTWLGHSYLYVPWGPCMDYTDAELTREVFTLLKAYADQKKVQFLRVDPNVVRRHHALDGSLIADGFSNEALTEQLKKNGYLHKGYGYAYNGSWTNRYTLIVDLSADEKTIVSRFSRQRKTALNRHAVKGIATRLGARADIPTLMEFERMLARQQGFKPHSRFFFEQLIDCFQEHAVLYVTEIDFEKAKDGLSAELHSGKYKNDLEARGAIEKDYRNMIALATAYGKRKALACGLFIRYGDMAWDLYTYNDKNLQYLQPVDNLHRFAMFDMKAHGVLCYDMVGFSGTADPADPNYGLYAYKSSFGPQFIEQIGEFDYVRSPAAMKRFRFEKLVVNHFKRRWWAWRYKKRP